MWNKAVFFDRDGTLNVNTDYLYKKEDFRWMPQAVEAIKYANDRGYLVIVVTNQSGVARGYYTEEDVKLLHQWMNEELSKKGAHIDAFYYCPYHISGSVPEYARDSEDRKPRPGMVLKAMADFRIDPRQSIMIGDKPLDVECAHNAGIKGVLYGGTSSLLKCLSSYIK